MDITIDNRAGINGDIDGIHFGVVPPGGISKKEIRVYNSWNYPVEAHLKLSGPLSGWVVVDTLTLLDPGEEDFFHLQAQIPKNAELGDYEGKIRVVLK